MNLNSLNAWEREYQYRDEPTIYPHNKEMLDSFFTDVERRGYRVVAVLEQGNVTRDTFIHKVHSALSYRLSDAFKYTFFNHDNKLRVYVLAQALNTTKGKRCYPNGHLVFLLKARLLFTAKSYYLGEIRHCDSNLERLLSAEFHLNVESLILDNSFTQDRLDKAFTKVFTPLKLTNDKIVPRLYVEEKGLRVFSGVIQVAEQIDSNNTSNVSMADYIAYGLLERNSLRDGYVIKGIQHPSYPDVTFSYIVIYSSVGNGYMLDSIRARELKYPGVLSNKKVNILLSTPDLNMVIVNSELRQLPFLYTKETEHDPLLLNRESEEGDGRKEYVDISVEAYERNPIHFSYERYFENIGEGRNHQGKRIKVWSLFNIDK